MFAVVRLGNQQFKVQAGDFIRAPFQNHSPEDKIELPVVAFSSTKAFSLGPSQLKGSKVKAIVLRQSLSKKTLVFKKKRRKGYRKTRGHRQKITELKILELKSPEGEISQVKWEKKPKASVGEKKADKALSENLKKESLTSSLKADPGKATKIDETKKSTKQQVSAKKDETSVKQQVSAKKSQTENNTKQQAPVKKSQTENNRKQQVPAKKSKTKKATKQQVFAKKAKKQAVGKTKSKGADIKKAKQDQKNKNLKSSKGK